ncbi:NADAR family protein [Bacteriovoracaceae bacterium]|nr:NADAR family protein [Bacteriovoracaceae bacterium]
MKKNWILLLLLSLLFSCSHQYPKHWYKPVEGKVKWWEITPDHAKEGEVILSKRNELGILSNFSHTPFRYDGKKYESIEGAWQAMKFPEDSADSSDPRNSKKLKWGHKRSEVEKMIAFKAKDAGKIGSKNMKKLKINWVTYKGKRMTYRTSKKGEHYKVIRAMMVEKVKQNPEVRKILLATGDLKLLPDHKVSPSSPPAWKYYDIYTEFRELLKSGKKLE